jgi:hypothetical protein
VPCARMVCRCDRRLPSYRRRTDREGIVRTVAEEDPRLRVGTRTWLGEQGGARPGALLGDRGQEPLVVDRGCSSRPSPPQGGPRGTAPPDCGRGACRGATEGTPCAGGRFQDDQIQDPRGSDRGAPRGVSIIRGRPGACRTGAAIRPRHQQALGRAGSDDRRGFAPPALDDRSGRASGTRREGASRARHGQAFRARHGHTVGTGCKRPPTGGPAARARKDAAPTECALCAGTLRRLGDATSSGVAATPPPEHLGASDPPTTWSAAVGIRPPDSPATRAPGACRRASGRHRWTGAAVDRAAPGRRATCSSRDRRWFRGSGRFGGEPRLRRAPGWGRRTSGIPWGARSKGTAAAAQTAQASSQPRRAGAYAADHVHTFERRGPRHRGDSRTRAHPAGAGTEDEQVRG